MRLRLATWIGAVLAGGGWWLAGSQPAPKPAGAARHEAAPPPTVARAPAAFTERLRQALETAPPPPRPERDPFRFSAPRPRPSTSPELPAAPSGATVDTVPAAPLLTLAGVATSDTPDGPVRTAVLSFDGHVLLVQEGDAAPLGLHVVRVADDHVVLADAAGVETTLRLGRGQTPS